MDMEKKITLLITQDLEGDEVQKKHGMGQNPIDNFQDKEEEI